MRKGEEGALKYTYRGAIVVLDDSRSSRQRENGAIGATAMGGSRTLTPCGTGT